MVQPWRRSADRKRTPQSDIRYPNHSGGQPSLGRWDCFVASTSLMWSRLGCYTCHVGVLAPCSCIANACSPGAHDRKDPFALLLRVDGLRRAVSHEDVPEQDYRIWKACSSSQCVVGKQGRTHVRGDFELFAAEGPLSLLLRLGLSELGRFMGWRGVECRRTGIEVQGRRD